MADTKITGLNALTAVADTDMCVVVDDPSGSAETKKITRADLVGSETITLEAGKVLSSDGGTVALPAVTVTGDLNTGIYAVGADKMGLSAGGVKHAGWDNTSGSEGFEHEGNLTLKNDRQIVSGDFPNSTTLYAWNMDATSADAAEALYGAGGGGTKIGAKDLTVKGAALGAANDVLGISKYCSFGGSAYLQSTDAVFNFTDTFSIGGWFYSTDWSPAGDFALISRQTAGTDGWMFYVTSAGVLRFVTYNGGVPGAITTDINSLTTSAWHNFVLTKSGTTLSLYVDGVLVNKRVETSTIAAAGNLEIGAAGGGSYLFTGRIDEVFIHNATVLTADQVRNIYARSAKKFAVKDQNTNIWIPEQNISSGVYTPTLTNTTNIAASTAYPCSWSRNGDNITCMLYVTVDPTAAAPTSTRLDFTLPIACAATPILGGSASSEGYTQVGNITAASATTAYLRFQAVSADNAAWYGMFQYVLN